MDIYENLLMDIKIPKFVKVKYNFPCSELADVKKSVLTELKKKGIIDRINCGNTVAIAAGSREISNLAIIIRTLADEIKNKGALPFVVPAMGSHGGATAAGQSEILAGFGITEKNIGIPVVSSMETVEVGRTETGMPVYMDKQAYEADCIIPVGRIKPHTDFRGEYESGLVKMITIGLGKQKGASTYHQQGFANMSRNLISGAKVSLEKSKIIFGLGIVENAFHGTYKIVALPKEEILAEEPGFLKEAKSLIPSIPFKKVDVIVVDEMGKNISGTGMDSNVIGRSSTLGIFEPFAEVITVLDLTDKSHGNANGMGLADVTTKRFSNKIILENTYPNTITGAEPKVVKIPVIMPNDEMAFKCALKLCVNTSDTGIRVVRIKNTLSLDQFLVSEALVSDIENNNNKIQIDGDPGYMKFDNFGNLTDLC